MHAGELLKAVLYNAGAVHCSCTQIQQDVRRRLTVQHGWPIRSSSTFGMKGSPSAAYVGRHSTALDGGCPSGNRAGRAAIDPLGQAVRQAVCLLPATGPLPPSPFNAFYARLSCSTQTRGHASSFLRAISVGRSAQRRRILHSPKILWCRDGFIRHLDGF